MVAKRIIPCLDVKDGRTVKGVNFVGLRDVGDAVELGAEYARQGMDFQQAEAAIRKYMTHTHLIFCLSSLNNLARNGRVSPLVAKATGLLGIRVVGKASAQGTLEPLHKCPRESKALAAIVRDMQQLGYAGGKIRIAHWDVW